MDEGVVAVMGYSLGGFLAVEAAMEEHCTSPARPSRPVSTSESRSVIGAAFR